MDFFRDFFGVTRCVMKVFCEEWVGKVDGCDMNSFWGLSTGTFFNDCGWRLFWW